MAIFKIDTRLGRKHEMTKLMKAILRAVLPFVLCLAAFGGVTGANSAAAPDFDPARVSWRSLTFEAKTMLAKVIVDIGLSSRSSENAAAALIAAPQGIPVQSSSMQVYQIAVNRTIDPAFGATIREEDQVWFDPEQGGALGRTRLRLGDDDQKKVYRFTQQGVFRLRRQPKDDNEARLAPEGWTDVRETFYPYSLAQLGCALASERSILIYLASAAALSAQAEPISMCVFGKRQLHRVKLYPAGFQSLKVNYIEKKAQVQNRKTGRIDALKIVMEAQPLESDLDEVENFSFLGFLEDIAIYLDPQTYVPIQASGRLPSIGMVDMVLQEVQLR
jgi:hypothetical protein